MCRCLLSPRALARSLERRGAMRHIRAPSVPPGPSLTLGVTWTTLTFVFCLLSLPVLAQSTDVAASFTRANLSSTSADDARLTFHKANGWAVSVNHFWTKNLSTELAYARTRSDGRAAFTTGDRINLGSLNMTVMTLVAQWHFGRSALVDPYLGAGAGRASARDLHSADLTAGGVSAIRINSRWSGCVDGGINVNLTPHVGVALDAKYLKYEPRSAAPGDQEAVKLKLNPFLISAGVRLRF